jgi:hypothetical protein
VFSDLLHASYVGAYDMSFGGEWSRFGDQKYMPLSSTYTNTSFIIVDLDSNLISAPQPLRRL